MPQKGYSSRGKKRKIIITAVIVSILAIVGGYTYYQKAFQPLQTFSGSDSGTAAATRGNITVSANGSGTLVAQTDAVITILESK